MGARKIVCKWLLMILKNCPSCAATKTLPVHTPWSKCCILVAPSAASQPGLGRQWLGCQKLPIRLGCGGPPMQEASLRYCLVPALAPLAWQVWILLFFLSSDWRAKEMKMLWKLTAWLFAPSQLKEALISGIGRLFTNWKIIKMVLRTVKNLIHL